MALIQKATGGLGMVLILFVVLSFKLYTISSTYESTESRCSDQMCSKLLTGDDLNHLRYCSRKSELLAVELEQATCHFMDGVGRSPVALASFPGSGNTWARGLLQDTTGICTGAIYCDTTLRKNGYPGECIRSGTVLVVKTHQIEPRWTGIHYDESLPFTYFKKLKFIPVYSSAIVLVRNPFDALVSEWNRLQTVNYADNHVNWTGKENFGEF